MTNSARNHTIPKMSTRSKLRPLIKTPTTRAGGECMQTSWKRTCHVLKIRRKYVCWKCAGKCIPRLACFHSLSLSKSIFSPLMMGATWPMSLCLGYKDAILEIEITCDSNNLPLLKQLRGLQVVCVDHSEVSTPYSICNCHWVAKNIEKILEIDKIKILVWRRR